MIAYLRRNLLLSLCLVAMTTLGWFTPGLWLRFDGWVQNQRDIVWEQLETAAGQKIAYDRIAPNVLSALDFQNVRLLADDGSTLFTAASVRLSWDWGLLFQGRFTQALRKIQIINAELTLDARRDQALLGRWADLLRPNGTGGGTSFDFIVEGYNLAARWTDGKRSLSLDRGFVVLSPEGREWGAKFRGALDWADKTQGAAYARAALRGELRSDSSFQNFSLRAEASLVRTTWFDLEPVTLQINVDPAQISIAKVADRIPLDLQAVWDRALDRWAFKGVAEGFKPSRLVRIKAQRLWAAVADGTLSGRFSYQPGNFMFSGHASWPQGALPAPLGDGASMKGTVSTREGAYLFEDFRLETPALTLRFEGDLGPDFLPEGTLALDRWSFADGEAKGLAHLKRAGNKVEFSGEDWVLNTLGSKTPQGWFEKTAGGWNFQIQGPWDGADGATYSASGSLLPAEPRVDVTIELVALPLALFREETKALFPRFDLPAEVWSLETSLRARVGWGAAEGPSVSVTSFAFYDPLVPDRTGTGTAEWRGKHLDLALNPASWDSVKAGGKLALDLEENGVIGGSLSGQLWEHAFDIQGRWVPLDKTLAFSGKPGVAGLIHQNEAGGWLVQLSLDPQEIAPGWKVGFQSEAALEDGKWSIDAQRVSVSGLYPWSRESFTAQGKAHADSGFLRVDDLILDDAHGSWAGSAVSSWSADFSSPWAGRLSLATPTTGRESLTVDWIGQALEQWHFTVKAAGLDVTRSGVTELKPLVGRLTASGALDWNGAESVWNVQTALSEARFGDSPLGFRAALSGTSHSVSVRGLNLSLSPIRILDGSADLDSQTRKWSAAMRVGLRVGPGDWESRWQADGGWTDGGSLSVTGALKARGNTWSQKSFPDWTLAGSWGSSGWTASLGDGGLSAQGEQGNFTVKAQAPFPVRGEAAGVWAGADLSLSVQNFRADLALLKDFINSKFFAISSGFAEGAFSVGGSLADPEVNGSLLLRDFTATSSFVRQPIGPIDVPVVLEGHRLRIDPVDIGPGSQTWMVSGGARLDHLLPEEYQFTIQTDALSTIPVSYQYTGLSAFGGVTGVLIVQGTPLAVTLGGKLILQDAVIALKPSSTSSSREPLGFNADLTLVTGRKVEFLWPNETLPLLRAVTNSGQVLVIKANDVASTWSVNGKLALRTGEINYLNRTFLLKEGQLTFQESQTGFDPRISVRAEWKLREASGPIIIGLRADGTLSRFSPRFDAVPFKSPEELQQLVGTTLLLPTDYTKATNVDTALSVASDVGTSFLLTPFEETVKKNFQLDLFTVKTEILKKSLLNRNGPLEASDYLDNTRLFFGKYIGDDLFLQGTLAFRQDANAATQVSPKMVVEPEFQMEFQTPLFLLNWTLLPQHPESLFVTDNTVTFRWNWSY